MYQEVALANHVKKLVKLVRSVVEFILLAPFNQDYIIIYSQHFLTIISILLNFSCPLYICTCSSSRSVSESLTAEAAALASKLVDSGKFVIKLLEFVQDTFRLEFKHIFYGIQVYMFVSCMVDSVIIHNVYVEDRMCTCAQYVK